MALIPQDQISILQTPAALRDAANISQFELTKGAVARAINLAANTGEKMTRWVGVLPQDVRDAVEAIGIVVAPTVNTYDSKVVPNSWDFSWE